MDKLAEVIAGFFGRGADLGIFLGAVGIIGGVGMSFIQALKDLTPLRLLYNRKAVRLWLKKHVAGAAESRERRLAWALTETAIKRLSERAAEANALTTDASLREVLEFFHQALSPEWAEVLSALRADGTGGAGTRHNATTDVHPDRVVAILERSLLVLAVDGDSDALYQLEADDLIAQVKAAFQAALEAPRRYEVLLGLAASWADPEDLATVLAGPPRGVSTKSELKARADYSDAKTRVSQQLQRAVDALEVGLAFRWKQRLQLYAFSSCIAVTTAVFVFGSLPLRPTLVETSGIVLVTSVLAGFFAPVARDIVGALARIREL